MLIYGDGSQDKRFADRKLKIRKEGKKWHLEYGSNDRWDDDPRATFTFDPDLVEFAPDMAHLGFGAYGLFLFWGSETSGDKAGFVSAAHRNLMNDMHHIATFFICEDRTTHMFSRIANLDIDESVGETEKISWVGSMRAGDALAKCIPEAADYIKRHHAKRKILGHINLNDSLAMLEAQLDMLTKIVLERIPEDERTDVARALAEATGNTSVLSLHPIDKLKETVKNQKTHIRSEQKTYFSERGTSPNNDPSA